MRIGIEAQRIFRKEKHGIEIFALELIKALQILDKTNEYFIFVKTDEDSTCLSETENFRIIQFGALTFGDWEQFHLPRKCKEFNIDLLHLTGNTAPLFYYKPYIQTIHDIIYLDKVDFGGTTYQNFGNLYRRFIVPRTAKNAHKIVTVSDYERKRIAIAFNLQAEKIRTIYNGINDQYRISYTENEIDALRSKYHLPDQFALFLGNTSPRKNALNALNAFMEFYNSSDKKTKLVTPALSTSIIEEYIKQGGNEFDGGAFACPGFIDKEDLPKIYQAATFLLFPSLSEGFGLPIIESMAMGCTVITSDTTSMPEIASGSASLVNPKSKGDIREKIKKIILQDELREELRKKGLERSKLFSWNNVALSYLELYSNTI